MKKWNYFKRYLITGLSLILITVSSSFIYAIDQTPSDKNAQINNFVVLTAISQAFNELTSKNVYTIKDSKVASYLRSNINNYVYNKNYEEPQNKINTDIKNSTNKDNLDSIDIMLLEKGKLLIAVPYDVANNLVASVFFVYDSKNITLTAAPFESEDGAEYFDYHFSNVSPALVVNDNTIQIILKAGDAGNCGSITVYKYINDFFKLLNNSDNKCS